MLTFENCLTGNFEGPIMSGTIVLAIATAGRGPVVHQTLEYISELEDQPNAVLVCLPEGEAPNAVLASTDTADAESHVPVQYLTAPKGLCSQRNAILEAAPIGSIVVFLDDDFLLGDGSISAVRRLFETFPDVAMATGRVVADGIGGPGLNHAEGLDLLRAARSGGGSVCEAVYNAYGCNMAVRMAFVSDGQVRFDTHLPLYGWLEDVDFSRRMARYGRIVRCDGLFGVHLGTKTGRSRGLPLGYSQIANPVYLIRKGTMSRSRAAYLMARNFAANLGRALWPEPWIDRVGRLRGNLTALADLAMGRLSPRRVLDL